MKKLILVATIGVAGLVSAKSSDNGKVIKKIEPQTEKKIPVKECGVVITYWSGGQVVGQETIVSDQPDLESCQKFQTGVKLALWAAGFWLS
ncbi:hypothetical protein ABXT08_16665 [Chryseobacterium sp. NRRL B-14859]|uniref:hypothetical protein n=1 Tax=unclassified Chryseobacterium TaxID=2593645 RepID=UPI00334296D1